MYIKVYYKEIFLLSTFNELRYSNELYNEIIHKMNKWWKKLLFEKMIVTKSYRNIKVGLHFLKLHDRKYKFFDINVVLNIKQLDQKIKVQMHFV